MDIEILIIIAIIIALGVIAGFGMLVWRIFRRKTISSGSNLRISFSSEETLSQLFFLLFVFFLAITVMSFNRNLGNVIEWPLVILSSSFISIFLSYRFKGILLLPVGLIGLFSWWFLKASEWISFESSIDMDIKDLSLFSLPLLFSLFLYVVGSMHGQNRKFERYAAVYNVLPVIAITVALFFVSTEFGIEALQEMTEGSDIFNSGQLSLSYILGGVIFIVGVFYSLGKNIVKPIEGAALFIYGAVFGLSVFLPDMSANGQNLYLAAFFNIFLLIHLVVMLFTGYLKKKDWFINLGSFSLFVFIIVKYFDWAFDFLDKSIFFISAGILLLVLGWFIEKGRRYMLSSSNMTI
ncbi:MAG: hypothetical protein UT90_C0019G0013 [Parcubacteria group bacterium GW2011_GWA1_40_21]|nr:MAG: hypothetical protein UT80_C0020G0008 [Parcubacteria group bacterium GW2011_GWC1_40_13]KKR52865.1 MAG: hypothetical protein UT90_C0019G0013 [Parcubacteria group bacterium GW2011_GWA1_40_21]